MDCEQRWACHGGGGVISQFSHNGIDLCGRVSPYFISCSFLGMDLTGDGETPEPKRFDAAEIDGELIGHSTPSDLCGWEGRSRVNGNVSLGGGQHQENGMGWEQRGRH